MDIFAYGPKINGCFIVQNIGNTPQKTIRIFNYPINYGGARDLLAIPGIGEGSIRSSLLKGELNFKIRAHEIVVLCSDVDLLQFNPDQKAFLQAAGITNGLDVSGAGGITEADHEVLRQIIHFVDDGPGGGFMSGAVKQTNPAGSPFPTQIVWFLDGTLTTKLVEKLITYNTNSLPITITWNVYKPDGVTIAESITDTITYTNNVFESSRVRTIS